MDYLIVIAVFAINYLVWRYLFLGLSARIFDMNIVLEVLFSLILYLYIPYFVALSVLKGIGLDEGILLNVMIVFCLVFISFLTYRNLKYYVAKK